MDFDHSRLSLKTSVLTLKNNKCNKIDFFKNSVVIWEKLTFWVFVKLFKIDNLSSDGLDVVSSELV